MSPLCDSSRCTIVAEIGQAHDGSLGAAHAYVDAAAEAGADAVKFQTHIASAESTPGEPWRVHFSPQDETRYEYWRRMEFTASQWSGLQQHAKQRGLLFLSSPFSVEAVELLARVGVDGWKIASGEVTNPTLLAAFADTDLPVLISTGMSSYQEIDEMVQAVRDRLPIVLLQCTSMYPCPAEKVGLNVIEELRQRYGCPVGLSDHSGTIYPGLAAAVQGIAVLETHLIFSRQCFGADVPVSLIPSELKQLIEGVRFIEAMKRNPVDKDGAARELWQMREMFTKSIVARDIIPAGTVLEARHLTVKKPGTGIPASQLPSLFGRMTVREVGGGMMLQEADLVGTCQEMHAR